MVKVKLKKKKAGIAGLTKINTEMMNRMETVRLQNTARHKVSVDALALRNRIMRQQVVQQAKNEHDKLLAAHAQLPLERHALNRLTELKKVIPLTSWRHKVPPLS